MLIAALGVLAALAFVLGLGALCLWGLKRWGAGSLAAKTRVPVEVVQRVPLGPRTGLTVVRVGEKVVALSVGENGVSTLFELDEHDRQRVIASSQTPVPHRSSAEAEAAFGGTPATGFAARFGSLLRQTILRDLGVRATEAAPDASVPESHHGHEGTPDAPARATTPLPFTLGERAEIPRFLTAPLMTRQGAPLTYARPGAAMLIVLAALLLGASMPLRAQVAPSQPAAQPAAPAAAPLVIDIPKLEMAPLVPIAPGRQPAVPARPAPRLTSAGGAAPQPPRAPRPGNGAALTPQAASARQPMNAVVVDSAQDEPPKAQPADPAPIAADDAIMRMMPQMDVQLGGNGENGGLRLNGTVGIVIMMGLLTLLPTLLLMMTGFTRILIVLQFLKQAMGTQSAPPGQLLAAMALLLTGFVMGPTLAEMNRAAITPWLDGKMTQVEMMKEGVKPMREFMLKQTRESDIKTFVELSRMPRPATVDDVPLHVLMSAFVASELRTAFQIGFAIYLPFIIIDTVVASVLMSMGMFMLPPAMISLPFKLLLFVLVDGWSLTITSLVQSFK
jgi:flagellar biosynthetic protein FliP